MLVIVVVAVIITCRRPLLRYYRYYHQRRAVLQWANSPLMRHVARVLDASYQGINGAALSIQERERLGIQDGSCLYGEVVLYSFADLLNLAHLKTDEVFYDLGSGVGKAVLMAALLYPLKKAVGIEWLIPLHDAATTACARAAMLRPELPIYFIQNDILSCDINDADVVFINATAFYGLFWDKLVEKLKQLKKGTRIILTSKSLHERYFKALHHGSHLMSWGLAFVSIYEKQ